MTLANYSYLVQKMGAGDPVAMRILDHSLRSAPTHGRSRFYFSQILNKASQRIQKQKHKPGTRECSRMLVEQTKRELETVVRDNPNHALSWKDLGNVHWHWHKVEPLPEEGGGHPRKGPSTEDALAARRCYEEALRMDPGLETTRTAYLILLFAWLRNPPLASSSPADAIPRSPSELLVRIIQVIRDGLKLSPASLALTKTLGDLLQFLREGHRSTWLMDAFPTLHALLRDDLANAQHLVPRREISPRQPSARAVASSPRSRAPAPGRVQRVNEADFFPLAGCDSQQVHRTVSRWGSSPPAADSVSLIWTWVRTRMEAFASTLSRAKKCGKRPEDVGSSSFAAEPVRDGMEAVARLVLKESLELTEDYHRSDTGTQEEGRVAPVAQILAEAAGDLVFDATKGIARRVWIHLIWGDSGKAERAIRRGMDSCYRFHNSAFRERFSDGWKEVKTWFAENDPNHTLLWTLLCHRAAGTEAELDDTRHEQCEEVLRQYVFSLKSGTGNSVKAVSRWYLACHVERIVMDFGLRDPRRLDNSGDGVVQLSSLMRDGIWSMLRSDLETEPEATLASQQREDVHRYLLDHLRFLLSASVADVQKRPWQLPCRMWVAAMGFPSTSRVLP